MKMPNIKKLLRYILLVFMLHIFWGCDFLSYDETVTHEKEWVFSSFERTDEFLTDIYGSTPSGFNSLGSAMRAAASDNAVEVNTRSVVHQFNDGSWSTINTPDAVWESSYEGIRKANHFLEESEGQMFEDQKYNTDYEDIMERIRIFKYEARFLRTYFYFELAKRYGGVPLITQVLEPEEANTVERASFEEVIDFIVSECEAIAPELPVDYHDVPQQETGRATWGAAMALKARALLYAASPLQNPSGDLVRWEKAAQAAKEVIDSGIYSLENEYSKVVNNLTSNELIWERRHGNSNSFERSNFPVGFEGADPGTAPSQNLVDAYQMQATGLDINEDGSGYDPSAPYEGRDPRLEATILRNGSEWKGREVETWTGGRDGPPQNRVTKTGYYLKKYVIEDVSLEPGNTTTATHTWVVFRYGEVLLNYAEAMNEAYGAENPADMGMTAREAVNLVRQRAGMPDIPVGMSQDEFREKLRNERRVELVFEDHRFWDIRRWKIGSQTAQIYGMDITQNDDGSFNYQRKLVEEHVWDEKMNLYPIPQSEIYKNENLEQNPGW